MRTSTSATLEAGAIGLVSGVGAGGFSRNMKFPENTFM